MIAKTAKEKRSECEVIFASAVTWGQLEDLAGVLRCDRAAFWKGKTEPQAKTELFELFMKRYWSN